MLRILVLVSCASFCVSAPVDWDSDLSLGFSLPDFSDFDFNFPNIPLGGTSCASLGCPADTNACNRKIETSKDKKTLDTTVKCFKDGTEIHESSTSAPNPNPDSQRSEYEYFGSFTGGTHNINIENNAGNDKTTAGGLETLE